jgi:hypothetical protein
MQVRIARTRDRRRAAESSPGMASGCWRLEQHKRLNQTAAGRAYRDYAAFFRERKWSWKKLNLALPLDLPPQRDDPDVSGKGDAEERVASWWR